MPKPKNAQVVLNAELFRRLAAGEPVKVRIPDGVTLLTINAVAPPSTNPVAEIIDVFFNRRPARR